MYWNREETKTDLVSLFEETNRRRTPRERMEEIHIAFELERNYGTNRANRTRILRPSMRRAIKLAEEN